MEGQTPQPFMAVFTRLRPTLYFTFTSYILKNQHPKLYNSAAIYTPVSRSGLSLHFSCVIHLHLFKTHAHLPLALSFYPLEDMITSGCSLMSVISSYFQILCCPPWRATQLSNLSVSSSTEFLCKMLHITQQESCKRQKLLSPMGVSYQRSAATVSCSCLRQQLPAPELFTSFLYILLSKIDVLHNSAF